MDGRELLGQLGELLADVELLRADAERWRELTAQLHVQGWGPGLLPGVIVGLIPKAAAVRLALAESEARPPAQEAAALGATTKRSSKRRLVTDDDRAAIRVLVERGFAVERISAEIGLAVSSVRYECQRAAAGGGGGDRAGGVADAHAGGVGVGAAGGLAGNGHGGGAGVAGVAGGGGGS